MYPLLSCKHCIYCALLILISVSILFIYVNSVTWTDKHQICHANIPAYSFQQSQPKIVKNTYQFTHPVVICRNADYYDYVLSQISNSTGFRKEMFDAILSLYDITERSKKPVLMRISDTLNATIYPLSFSIPATYIVDTVPAKMKPFGRVIPDVMSTYYKGAIEESLYHKDMSESYYAITFKKGGWDCLRIVEILASGCLPLFVDIDSCPTFPLALHPKSIYKLIKRWPGLEVDWKYTSRWNDITISKLQLKIDLDIDLYRVVVSSLLQYTRNILSTTAMAEYFLSILSDKLLDGKQPQTILYLTHYDVDVVAGDYTTDSLLHGLHTLMNSTGIVDYPCRHMLHRLSKHFNLTEGYLATKDKLYGHGYTLGLSLDAFIKPCAEVVVHSQDNVTSHESDTTAKSIEESIRKRLYDIVVIASGHRYFKKQELIRVVCEVYPKNRVVVIDGADLALHPRQVETFSSCASLFFSREGPSPHMIQNIIS